MVATRGVGGRAAARPSQILRPAQAAKLMQTSSPVEVRYLVL